jgi:hypothetical protein
MTPDIFGGIMPAEVVASMKVCLKLTVMWHVRILIYYLWQILEDRLQVASQEASECWK